VVNPTVFTSAARSFSLLVDELPPDVWDRPGLGVWDVRALVGHTSRSLITVSTYIRRPAATESVETPEHYYALIAAGAPGSPAADAAAVEQRGRDAGTALGDDPASAVRSLLDSAVSDVDRGDDPLIETIAGGMRLSAYLPTRTFELVVHCLDIAATTGAPYQVPVEALTESLQLAARVTALRGVGVEVLRALTGRERLRAGFSIV
jgi:uncharacterized protein (TIGR03083 family)